MSQLLYILTVVLAIAGNIAQWGACCPVGSLHRCAAWTATKAHHQHSDCACHHDASSHQNESMPEPLHVCGGDPMLYIDAPLTFVERDLSPANDFAAVMAPPGAIESVNTLALVAARTNSLSAAPALRADLPVYRL